MTTQLRFIVASAVLVGAFGATAQAAMLDSYDVYLNGTVQSGANFDTEGYAANGLDFAIAAVHNVPNVANPAPRPPFASAANNTLRISDVAGIPLGNGKHRYTLWMRGPLSLPNDTFINDLDANSLVTLGLTMRFDDLDALDKVVVPFVEMENGALGFYDPDSWQTSGVGTVDNPLLLEVFLNPTDIQAAGIATSHVKIIFDTMTMRIPEPTTAVLFVVGLMGLVGRRRR